MRNKKKKVNYMPWALHHIHPVKHQWESLNQHVSKWVFNLKMSKKKPQKRSALLNMTSDIKECCVDQTAFKNNLCSQFANHLYKALPLRKTIILSLILRALLCGLIFSVALMIRIYAEIY